MTVGPKYFLNNATTSSGGKSNFISAIRGVICRSETRSPKRALTSSGTPQSTGGGIGGGGRYLVDNLNICPAKPVGVQLAIAIRPPGLHTRTSSSAVTSGRGANIAPNIVITRSNKSSA